MLPHFVKEDDLAQGRHRAPSRPASRSPAIPDKAFQEAEAVSEGTYGIPVITHCCLEPHGQVIQWNGDKVELLALHAERLRHRRRAGAAPQGPAANINVQMDYIGGGFGSKFAGGAWGVEVRAPLAKKRRQAGQAVPRSRNRTDRSPAYRPSHFAKIKVGAKKDGTITAWQSESWATGGFAGGGNAAACRTSSPTSRITRLNHTAVSLNTGATRAWRAPNNQQASFLTCSALEDLAAKLEDGSDGVLQQERRLHAARPMSIATSCERPRRSSEWKKIWQPRGDGKGPVQPRPRHRRQHLGRRRPRQQVPRDDQSRRLGRDRIGTQDLGTGTRTIIAQVAAETWACRSSQVKREHRRQHVSCLRRPSGGSTTVGGVSSSTRKATRERADQAVRSGGSVARRPSPISSKRWTAASASRAIPTRA